jgi:hypothetical protein
MAESTVQDNAVDEMLFHDLVAIAARVEDEADRIRTLGYFGASSDIAHQAGIAYAKLDALEDAMFDTANTLHSLASDVTPESASVAKRWSETKQACREARQEAQRLTALNAHFTGPAA